MRVHKTIKAQMRSFVWLLAYFRQHSEKMLSLSVILAAYADLVDQEVTRPPIRLSPLYNRIDAIFYARYRLTCESKINFLCFQFQNWFHSLLFRQFSDVCMLLTETPQMAVMDLNELYHDQNILAS